jgi:uncharacterized integral membrane protein
LPFVASRGIASSPGADPIPARQPRKCASDAAVRLPPMELGLIVIVVAFALTLLLLVFWW